MPISPISPMPPTTNSPLSSLSSMSPLSSLSSLSSMVGQPNQPMGGPKNVQGMNAGMMMGPNPNPNMQPFQSSPHHLTPGMSPQVHSHLLSIGFGHSLTKLLDIRLCLQGNTNGPPNMMMKMDQPGNFDNMMMKGDQIPSNPNFDNSGNINMMKGGDPMSNFDNPNQMMMKNDPGMQQNLGPNHPMMNNVMKQVF